MISPSFAHDNVPIVFATDQNYLPYLGVAIHSLLSNASIENNYDIYILTEFLSPNERDAIMRLERANARITFVDLLPFLQKYGHKNFHLEEERQLTIATYYRLFIPEIFANLSRILYLDSDIIVTDDIAELYHSSLEGCSIGAFRDTGIIQRIYTASSTDYWTHELQLENIHRYFNAGTMIFDLEKIQKLKFSDILQKKLLDIKNPIFQDQDILNSIFNTDVKLLDGSWNAVLSLQPSQVLELPSFIYQEFVDSVEKPKKLIHYCADKPWKQPYLPLAHYFWQYACQTEFYQEIVDRYKKDITKPSINIRQDRWYRFGQLSRKRKLWTIAKVLSKRLRVYRLLRPAAKFIERMLRKA